MREKNDHKPFDFMKTFLWNKKKDLLDTVVNYVITYSKYNAKKKKNFLCTFGFKNP